MALYDYKCDKCGHTVEVNHKMAETPTIMCEHCYVPMKKQISASGFSLKGDGWYKAGYSGKK